MTLKDIALRYFNGTLTTSDPVALNSSLSVAGQMTMVNAVATGNVHGTPTPANHGGGAWSWDPAVCSNNQVAIAGSVYLIRMFFPVAVTISTIYWHVNTVAVTPTTGQNEVGLYSSAGTKLVAVNVDSLTTSTGLKSSSVTGQAFAAGSTCWVGLVFNAATPPQLARGTGLAGAGGLVNFALTATNYRFAINGTAQTVLPSSITPASNLQGTAFWAAVGP